MFKVYSYSDSEKGFSVFVAEYPHIDNAKSLTKIRKQQTGKDYFIKDDGIKIWDTKQGDNINIRLN